MLKDLVRERLLAAADEIFGLFQSTIASYEEQLLRAREESERQRRQLEAFSKTQLVFHIQDAQGATGHQAQQLPPQLQGAPAGLEHTQPLHVKEEGEATAAPTKSDDEPRESQLVMTETKGRRGADPQGDRLFAPLSDSDDIEELLRSGTDSEEGREATRRDAERELQAPDFSADVPNGTTKGKRPDFVGEEGFRAGNKASGAGSPKQKKAKVAAERQTEEEFPSGGSRSSPAPEESAGQESSRSSQDLQSRIDAFHQENVQLWHMLVDEIPTLLREVKKLVSVNVPNAEVDRHPTEDADGPDPESDGPPSATPLGAPVRPTRVKIGNDGVTVSSHCWESAKTCTTANSMARVLLTGLFDVEVLLKSNLKGGFSKSNPGAERRQALDPRKLQALRDAVVAQFPAAKEADMRKSINGRMCELRYQMKRKTLN